ncbi:MAG: hypothetical protein J7L04_06595 [Bacteroidales bacterium]|nr:hypothetical protein [Bacteroidales bacterium]
MVHLEIKAAITPSKRLEFYQTVLSFINDIQDTNGYLCFTQKNGTDFNIKISWKNQNCLDSFLKSNQYKAFHGAIITLSTKNNIDIVSGNLKKSKKVN